MGSEKRSSLKVVMLPWLAHGHISPFMELAKKLSLRNFTVYLCSTPVNLLSVKKKMKITGAPADEDDEDHRLHLLELNLPSLPELPPHYHTTNGLPLHLHPTLKRAFEMAGPDLSAILEDLSPDLFINDGVQPWATALASSLHIPTLIFLTSGAATCSFFTHALMKTGDPYPFSAIFLRDYEVAKLTTAVESAHSESEKAKMNKEVKTDLFRFANILLIKTFDFLEGKYVRYMSDLTKRRIVPLGPLVEDPPCEEEDEGEHIDWLNGKEKSSTVFVSFGSEYFMSKEDMEEIALGLELSGANFIWVVRFPKGDDVTVEEVLPEGFIERIGGRGKIVEGWAPQYRILRHESVGGFMSHCGWGSVMESLKVGIPIIATPMHLDQPLNARMLVEVGVGVEAARDANGMLRKEEIAKVTREVLFEQRGEGVRRKAKEMSETMNMKEVCEIDEFVKVISQLM